MEDFMLTASMAIMAAILFFVKYILPLGIAIMGAYFVKKRKKNVGYILVAVGLIAEVASISTKFVNL